MSQRFWLSAHWMQVLPSGSSFHLQSIQEKFMAPLCCSELQAKAAVLTWQRPEEQQEQKCCQLPLGRGRPGLCMEWAEQEPLLSPAQLLLWQKGRDGALWMSGEHSCCSRHLQLPSSPSHGWAVLSVALDCTGLCFKTPHKSFSKEISWENQPPEGMHLHLHSRSVAWRLIAKGFFRSWFCPKFWVCSSL